MQCFVDAGVYDGGSHTPKLLPCSHTVCLECLSHIASSQTRDTGSFRCPICRELIHIPRGGVAALPPSFLVNQLLDLMSRQRREVIPKCSVHINQVSRPILLSKFSSFHSAKIKKWDFRVLQFRVWEIDWRISGARGMCFFLYTQGYFCGIYNRMSAALSARINFISIGW